MRFPIRYKLTGIILIIFIPLIVVSIHHYFELIEHDRQETEAHNLETALSVSKSLDMEIQESFALLEMLSKHPLVSSKDSRECSRFFTDILSHYPDVQDIVAVETNGAPYCGSNHSAAGRPSNYKETPWFKSARKGKFTINVLSLISQKPVVMISRPVFGGKKQNAVMGLSLDLAEIRNDIADSIPTRDKSFVLAVDPKGTVIMDMLHAERAGSNIGQTPFLQKALHQATGCVEDSSLDGVRRLYCFAPMANAPWKVFIGVSMEDVYGHARIFSGHYLWWITTVGFLVLAMAVLVTRRVTKNVLTISRGMKEIENGNLDVQLTPSGGDELSDLAKAFNAMTESRNNVERQLKKSQSFLSSVLDGIGEGLVVIDRDFRIISANKKYCEQINLPCESIINRHCYEISHHIYEPCHEIEGGCECTVDQCFKTGSHHMAIHTHYNKEGAPIYIETHAYPLKDDAGNITSAIETMTDVTDRVELEKRLGDIKEQYRKLYDDAPDMMHSTGKDGAIIICNRTETEVLGYDFDEIIGRHFTDIFAPEEREACTRKFEAIKKEGFFEGEVTLLAKDGRRVPVVIKARSVYDDNGEFLMTDAVLRDVTEKKLLEAQLLQAQKMEAVGQLSGGIAHDFNNILTAVIGFGNLLKANLREDDPQQRYVGQILDAADKAARLTHSLLAFSRKQIVNLKQTRLNEIITRLEQLLQRVIGEDIELKTFLSANESEVLADSVQIEQVLMNLCANSRDAMPEGGTLIIETEAVELDEEYVRTHALTKPGKYMLISVSDTGAGMDEKTASRIFEPFFTTKEIGKGTGLGLSTVYGIIRQHEGYVNVYSERGKGTTFKIYLPAAAEGAVETTEEEKPAPAPVSVPDSGGTETILLAEDDPALREYSKNVLEEYGYRLITAENGEDALEKFKKRQNQIDLLVLDVIMPKKNGKEVYDEIRKHKPDMKALFMSGYTANIIHSKGILKTGIKLITKPFTPSSLLQKVRSVLDAQ